MDKLLAGRHILVVEDEMLVLMMIEDMLTDLGCTSIAAAATSEDALAQLADRKFDAVMLDVNLNGRSSHPVAKALAMSGTPFIYSTGSSVSEIEVGFKDRPLLRKPFGFELLASAFGALFTHQSPANEPFWQT